MCQKYGCAITALKAGRWHYDWKVSFVQFWSRWMACMQRRREFLSMLRQNPIISSTRRNEAKNNIRFDKLTLIVSSTRVLLAFSRQLNQTDLRNPGFECRGRTCSSCYWYDALWSLISNSLPTGCKTLDNRLQHQIRYHHAFISIQHILTLV